METNLIGKSKNKLFERLDELVNRKKYKLSMNMTNT